MMNTTTREKVHPTITKPTSTTTNQGQLSHGTTARAAMTTATTTTTTTATTAASPKFPPVKAQQLPVTARYHHRPPPALRYDHRQHRRGRHCCTCKCCFLTILLALLIMIALLVLAAVTSAMFYAVYRPRPPSFTLPSLNYAQFNLTSPPLFTSTTKLNLTMITNNPNDKITFYYNPINITVFAHKGSIEIGQGYIPGFVHQGKNTTTLTATVKNDDIVIDDTSFGILKNDLNKQKKDGGGLDLKVILETEMNMKIGNKVKSKKFGLRVSCDGIKLINNVPAGGKNNGTLFTADIVRGGKCNVQFFIKLFEWEIHI